MKRRDFLKGTLAVAAAGLLNPALYRHGLQAEEGILIPFEDALAEYTEGEEVLDGSDIMQLDIPDAPPSGATVPVEVTIDHPMEADNYISNITVLTTKNKANKAMSMDMTPENGMAYLFVNVKLGQTQDVVVMAKTNGGKIYKVSKKVKVALGGCG